MPRSRPPYPREFREEAVRLVWSSARAIAQIARELGIASGDPERLREERSWTRGFGATDLPRRSGRSCGGCTEENRILREEREILKKAAAFFARETESKPYRLGR